MDATTFKIGDRVEVRESIGDYYQQGERGIVVEGLGPYVHVQLDNPRYGMVDGHIFDTQSTSFEPHELILRAA